MKVGGVSPQLARAREYMKRHPGYDDSPIKKASFNEKTKTLEIEVNVRSELVLGKTVYKKGVAGTTKVYEAASWDKIKGTKSDAPSLAKWIGEEYSKAGLTPTRVIIKETFVSEKDWRRAYNRYKNKKVLK